VNDRRVLCGAKQGERNEKKRDEMSPRSRGQMMGSAQWMKQPNPQKKGGSIHYRLRFFPVNEMGDLGLPGSGSTAPAARIALDTTVRPSPGPRVPNDE
jgi:hypothetical protein